MSVRWALGTALLGAVVVGLLGAAQGRTSHDEQVRRARVGASESWASRAVWACDRRKLVIVEGVRAGQKIPPERAQQVADVLTDLMRY